MEPFILDNTIRETSVAAFRGHTLLDKIKIFNLCKQAGFRHMIIATFTKDVVNVDEKFVLHLQRQGIDFSNFFAFSEWAGGFDESGVPYSLDVSIPLGLAKMKQLGIINPILEVDVACKRMSWNNITEDEWLDRFEPIIDWIHNNLSMDSKIIVNIRDMPLSASTQLDRVKRFIRMLGSLPAKKRPFAIIFEDPNGDFPVDNTIYFVICIRKLMDSIGWHPHFLIHVHCAFGLADSAELEAMGFGCSGMWGAVTKEGACTGHASSCVALTNLARLGCRYVLENYDMSAVRNAAIEVTKIVTGRLPHPTQEVYGAHALHQVFSANNGDGGMMGAGDALFLLPDLFKEPHQHRVSNMSDRTMIQNRLQECFGGAIDDWDEGVAADCRLTMFLDGIAGLSCEYTSPLGIGVLYIRTSHEYPPGLLDMSHEICESNALIREFKVLWASITHSGGEKQCLFEHKDINSLDMATHPAPKDEDLLPISFQRFSEVFLKGHDIRVHNDHLNFEWKRAMCLLLGVSTGELNRKTEEGHIQCGNGDGDDDDDDEEVIDGADFSTIFIEYANFALFVKWALLQFESEIITVESMIHLALSRCLVFSVNNYLDPHSNPASLLSKDISKRFFSKEDDSLLLSKCKGWCHVNGSFVSSYLAVCL